MLISIVVPIYKVEKYLSRCVDSILSQTFTDFELILVDDGSPDNCGDICEEYAKVDKRIKVIHQKNGGLSAARNSGIEWAFANSNSQWITFIDSDDWIHPRYLEVLLNAATESNLPVSICGYLQTEGEVEEISPEKFNAKICSVENFFMDHNVNAVVAWGKLYKKEYFKALRYPVGKLNEDEFTTYKILFQLENVAVVEAKMYYYFVNAGSIMNSSWSIRKFDVFDAMEERILFFKEKNLDGLSKWQINYYLDYLYNRYNYLLKIEDSEEKKQFLSLFKQRCRESIKKYRCDLGFSAVTMSWLYEIAYPREMKYYWLIKAMLNKLRGKREE